MAISVGDAVLKLGVDTKDLDRGMKGVGATFQKHQAVIGAAFTAIGAAGLKLVDSARKMNAQLGVSALNLGVTAEEMRELALDTTNVTFPLEEVIASFDLLARAGVEDTKILEATATAFDTLGDAVGMGASQVTAKMVPAMKTFHLTASEVATKTDLMTNLVRNSTVSLDNFGSVIGYVTPELVNMGLTLEDTVALMAIMEGKGMSGEVATRAFRTAITQATREQIPLQEALGITTEEMDLYRESLEGIDGMTEKYAETANEQYGIMDKLKQKWSELTLQYGTFLQPLEPILATMTALGPVMLLFSTVVLPKLTFATAAATVKLIALAVATKAVTVAQWLWNIAMLANPIGLVIIVITALIAIIAILATNVEQITKIFTDAWVSIRDGAVSAFTAVKNIVMEVTGWVTALFDAVKSLWEMLQRMLATLRGVPPVILAGTGFGGPMEQPWAPGYRERAEEFFGGPAEVVVPRLQTGGFVTGTGMAQVHRGETVVPAGGQHIHIYLDGNELEGYINQRIIKEVRLQGGV